MTDRTRSGMKIHIDTTAEELDFELAARRRKLVLRAAPRPLVPASAYRTAAEFVAALEAAFTEEPHR